MTFKETTDMTLFVRTSEASIARWDRRRITEALMREAKLDADTADAISREVEKEIVASGMSVLTSSLIRDLVDAKLIERGLDDASRLHARLGVPLYDVEQLILHPNRENANIPHGPEGTNLVLAEGIKRDYALHRVFSQDVADAHARGDIHIHGLGFVDRVYSASLSLGYLKKFGLNLPHALTVAKPAKHAEVLLAHMVRFAAGLQSCVSGSIGWRALNISFAPFLSGMSDREVRQFAQMLVYEFSQLTAARGGQAMFTDIHMHWEIPRYLEGLHIAGPSGQPAGRAGDWEKDAQRFAWALFEVYKKGDGAGNPFIFPRPILHITPKFFETPGHEEFLEHVCDVSIARGNPCFVLDRDDGQTLRFFGYTFPNSEADSLEPWTIRHFAIADATLNLPRLAYKAGGDDRALLALLDEAVALVVKAHNEKRIFIEKLLDYGEDGPLALLAMNRDGHPYLRMKYASYLVGMVGLNEMVQQHLGQQLHESEEALAFGLKIMKALKASIASWQERTGMTLILDQSHAETTAHRFARLDLKHYSPASGRRVRGDIAGGRIYYTNSTRFAESAPVSPFVRAEAEGRFHPLIEGEKASFFWLGEEEPPVADLKAFVERVYRETTNAQVIVAPDFTTCRACGKAARGLHARCSLCGSPSVDGVSLITQYFSRVSSWNKGKLAELRDRIMQKTF